MVGAQFKTTKRLQKTSVQKHNKKDVFLNL